MQASHGIAGIMVRELRRLVSRPLYLLLYGSGSTPLLPFLYHADVRGVAQGYARGSSGRRQYVHYAGNIA